MVFLFILDFFPCICNSSLYKNLSMIIIYACMENMKILMCIVLSEVEARDHYDYQQQERCRRPSRHDRQTCEMRVKRSRKVLKPYLLYSSIIIIITRGTRGGGI